jgi:serine/threonine protein kinase
VIGSLFADRYHITGALGNGSFGQVWRAVDTHQGMDVALKLLAPGSDVIHAYREASILTALEGDHVLRVYNADTYIDVPYLATRIAPRGSADDALAMQPLGLRPDRVVTWVRHMLVGLGTCQARGLAHRDIKPGNLFLDREDWALLGDFGIAHPVDAAGRVPVGGSPVTMAPEMYATGWGTFVSDIYSVGATAYRLLTGAWPFDAPTTALLAPLVVAGGFVRVRDRAPHLTRRLADRVERALALGPADRFADWRAMHLELGRPRLVARVWEPHGPHPGHARCWRSIEPAGSPAYEVCTIPGAGSSQDIEVRRVGARSILVRGQCERAVPRGKALPVLRAIFDTL